VTQPFLERFCSADRSLTYSRNHGSESCAGRPETSFLDFWSTFSALYGPDEGLKDAATVAVSFGPLSGPYRALEVDHKSRKLVSVLRPRPPPISVHAV
jgi:hypothetical protein